jgi:apolipoprotein N-acyltransferase
MQRSRPTDRFSWLWLLIGAILLPFTQLQTVMVVAVWLAPVFLLHFARTQRAMVALPMLAVVHYGAAVVALRNIIPAPEVYLFGLIGEVAVVNYIMDKLVAQRLNGLARTLVFPATYVVTDWLFGQGSLGTTASPAYAIFGNLPLIQVVSITGIWGVVFLLAWFAPVANEVWERGINWSVLRASLAPFVVVLLAVALYGSVRVAFFAPVVPTVRIAALAADRNLREQVKTPIIELAQSGDTARAAARETFTPIVDDLFERTKQQAQAGAKIIVWAEGAAFVLKEDEPDLLTRGQALARQESVYLEMGVLTVLRTDHFPFGENRAILIDPQGAVVWDYFKAIHPMGDAAIFAPGPGVIPTVQTPYGRLATVICFDGDFPTLMRQSGQAGADILLIPANDWQPVHIVHARVATFRSVENGVALVRATGNGLSIAVDDLGQPLATVDYFATDKATLVADVPSHGRATLYARIGDTFTYLCMAGLVTLIMVEFVRRGAEQQSVVGGRPVTA